MTTAEVTLENQISILTDKIKTANHIDLDMVNKAVEFGKSAHQGQFRRNGDFYFIHPVRVAIKATEYNLDTTTIITSLLHDAIEDSSISNRKNVEEAIHKEFGETIFNLVDALTKDKESQNLTLYKIFQIGNIDFRVILIKLLDRLDNLSDLAFLPRRKQRRICLETAGIYVEIAQGLGLLEIEEQLRDFVFQHLYPTRYQRIANELEQFRSSRSLAIEGIVESLKASIPDNLLLSIDPRFIRVEDFLFSQQGVERILSHVRIMTPDPLSCYQVIGHIHTTFRSVPLTIRDFISNPKANGWQGITSEVMINGEQVSIRIVSQDFPQNNRKGILTLINEGIYQSDNYQEFLKLYLDVASDNIRIEDVFRYSKARTIQTLTPAGDIIELRYGSTILDFAFMVHTELGLKSVGGIINGVRYPRNKIVEDGMVIKVLTSDSVIAEKEWLDYVVMPKSRKELLKHVKKKGALN